MADFVFPSDEELVLRTPRLVLRPSRVEDTPLLFEHCSDPLLPRLMTWAPHRDPGETKDFLVRCQQGRQKGEEVTWCVFEDGRLRGFVGIERIARTVLACRYDRAELGYWVARAHHNRGIVTEAAGAALACAFGRLALRKVVVRAATENGPSLRVIEKLGFTKVGLLREDIERDGRRLDVALYEMLSTDPAAARLQSQSAASR